MVALIAGVVAFLLFFGFIILLCRHRRRAVQDRDIDTFNRVSLRIINPQKKNSLNRRNDANFQRLKMLDKAAEEEEEMDLMMEGKCNLNNVRSQGLRKELLKGEFRFNFKANGKSLLAFVTAQRGKEEGIETVGQ